MLHIAVQLTVQLTFHLCVMCVQVRAVDRPQQCVDQRDIDPHKRLVLVDWLIEVVDEFKLGQETLFLAVNALDRYLARVHVSRSQLQLVGITCLWVACKYEEVYPPVLADFVEITDSTYTGLDLIAMEEHVLHVLKYQLSIPTAITFLQQYLQPQLPAAAYGRQELDAVHTLAEYVLEISLLVPDMLKYKPSVVAAAALRLAHETLGLAGSGHNSCLTFSDWVTADSSKAVGACKGELHKMHTWASYTPKSPAVKDRYAHLQRKVVATIPPLVELPSIHCSAVSMPILVAPPPQMTAC